MVPLGVDGPHMWLFLISCRGAQPCLSSFGVRMCVGVCVCVCVCVWVCAWWCVCVHV